MGKIETLVERVQGQRIYFDTNALIYFFDRRDPYFPVVAALVQACDQGVCYGYTGDAAVAELMVHPYRSRNPAEIARGKAFFARKNFISVLGHDASVFDTASQLRALANLKLIDALHHATATQAHCAFLVTQNQDFDAISTTRGGVQVIRLQDFIAAT